MNGTNNIQLDNLRLSNKVLENKLNEQPDNYSNLKAIGNKLIEYNNKLQDKINLSNNFDRLIGYNNNLQDKINLTTSFISDIQNNNMELNDRLNRMIEFGNNFVDETERKFKNHELKQEKPIYDGSVFNNPDEFFASEVNPIFNETFDLGAPISGNEETKTEQPKEPEETKTEQPNEAEETKTEQVNQPVEQTNELNTSNVTNAEDNFIYKKIKKQKILRGLLKQIETKPTRKLLETEKNILKPFYKAHGVKWMANTQTTGGVKNQLAQFNL